ncbi:MAG: hypothetical protein ACI4EW_08695 [Butyrivibrio sp.]
MAGFFIKNNTPEDAFIHHCESLCDADLCLIRDLLFEDFSNDLIDSVEFLFKSQAINNEMASRFVRQTKDKFIIK